jgi:transcriptional regulator with XRE-family HTH domain
MSLAPEEIGRRIRDARLAHGWTHEELARRAGVNWRTVQRWQKGKLPRLATLMQLADVLGLPHAYLIDPQNSGATLEDLERRVDELARRVESLSKALQKR